MVIRNFSLSLPLLKPKFLDNIKFEFHGLPTFFSASKKIYFNTLNFVGGILHRKRTSLAGEGVAATLPKKRFSFSQKSKKIVKVLLLIIIGVIIIGAAKLLGRNGNLNDNLDGRFEVGDAKATQDVKREFTFPLKNNAGEVVSSIKYMIEKAEIRDQIIVEGKKATAIKGRTFVIITLKITNEFTQPIEIKTRDYVRLSVNGNREEWLAPDIHNDPVEIQAISTKYTRVGFPVNDNDSKLVLRIGEIEADKQEIELTLK